MATMQLRNNPVQDYARHQFLASVRKRLGKFRKSGMLACSEVIHKTTSRSCYISLFGK